MNWVSHSSWLWRALRGHSVTFAALFAFSVLGISAVHVLRQALGALGAPWLLLLILPIVLVSTVARRESEWMPDEEQRKRWSRRLVFGAIALSALLALLAPKPTPPAAGEQTVVSPVRLHGPSGK